MDRRGRNFHDAYPPLSEGGRCEILPRLTSLGKSSFKIDIRPWHYQRFPMPFRIKSKKCLKCGSSVVRCHDTSSPSPLCFDPAPSPPKTPFCDWRHSNVNTKMIIIVIMWKYRIPYTPWRRGKGKAKAKQKLSPPRKNDARFSPSHFRLFFFYLISAKCFARFFFVSVCFLISRG